MFGYVYDGECSTENFSRRISGCECLGAEYPWANHLVVEICLERSLGKVGIPVQDYKFIHAVVMIYVTLVNTHTHTDRPLILLAQPAEVITVPCKNHTLLNHCNS